VIVLMYKNLKRLIKKPLFCLASPQTPPPVWEGHTTDATCLPPLSPGAGDKRR